MVVITASRDIEKGEELFVDYCIGETKTARRNKALKKHGIEEEMD